MKLKFFCLTSILVATLTFVFSSTQVKSETQIGSNGLIKHWSLKTIAPEKKISHWSLKDFSAGPPDLGLSQRRTNILQPFHAQ